MKQTIKGLKWKENSPQKGILNLVRESKRIEFKEKETKDIVLINIEISENEYALYSEEYLPATLTPSGHKKADITVVLLNESKNKGVFYLGDVKSDIGGKDVIIHLCEQWNAGIEYLNNSIIAYLDEELNMEEHLVVITRNFDISRIKAQLNRDKKEIERLEKEAEVSLAAVKLLNQRMDLRKSCEILEKFAEHKFLYKNKKCYSFEVIKLEPFINEEYKAELSVCL